MTVVRMGSVLYFDCFSGASGDMVLGALIDLGVPLSGLRQALAGLLPEGCELHAERVTRSGISATRFQVVDAHAHHGAHAHRDPAPDEYGERGAHSRREAHPHHGHEPHRGLGEILGMIGASELPERVKAQASRLFERLARVEADIHQVPVERVHFHEVGALDSIVDIVGAVWAIDALRADRVVSSPLNTGGGTVETAHGLLPVPAPATLRLLEGVPAYGADVQAELVTPTGALLVTGHAAAYGPMPRMVVGKIGYGAGQRDLPGRPNLLRVALGEEAGVADDGRILSIECNLDDMNPQFLGGLFERLQASGALDVFFTPVQMKKNRPGTLVTVLAPPPLREAVVGVLFRETTTIGVRYHEVERECLLRDWRTVTTRFGPVRIKIARRGAAVMNAAPEYEDCAALAESAGVAVREVHQAALHAYLEAEAT
ncbi:MAG TPA: nickel pincer cofactor biosynthesis protein LarC [Vicinamibacterales bacterium]|nr:nickel pincer cofactor biosynthesis protein LarC [Vicinamibacterales bacterium]HPK71635.1 nickel pincer cofactor biosynthesis protein LarC [Vicinamibacterales bacterium]